MYKVALLTSHSSNAGIPHIAPIVDPGGPGLSHLSLGLGHLRIPCDIYFGLLSSLSVAARAFRM